jgi:phenylacetate-CoA ligase
MRKEQRRRVTEALDAFFTTPLGDVLERHFHHDPREEAVRLFHAVAASVPAYRAFLAEHDVDPASVRAYADFEELPVVTKQNYLLRHPLPDLCRDGRLDECDMIAVSSGSTGKPAFWPRFVADELEVARRFEQVFHDSFRADERRTLAVVCFALGTWVGGMYTASCCRHLAAKGYPITVVTPGNNKDEIFRVLADLGPLFDQVVLLGYPPFLKDVIDTGRARAFDFRPLRLKWVTAGEVFSEEWRSLMGERAGATSPCFDSASLYGTADAGVIGNETPLTIAVRRFLASRPDAARAVFGQDRLPTLVQYDPMCRFFEAKDGMLLFSGDNGVPLVRYGILDSGGLLSFADMMAKLDAFGFDPRAELGEDAKSERIPRARGKNAIRGARALPFVWVFGRSDFTVSYFGANIFPENVTVGLEQPGVREWVTGKFVLEAREDADHDLHLSILVELAPGAEASEPRALVAAQSIEEQLCRLNSEFASYVPRERRAPKVTLVMAGHPEHFPIGVKHRYTRKSAG